MIWPLLALAASAQTEKAKPSVSQPITVVDDDGDMADLHARLLEQDGLQFERPEEEVEEEEDPPEIRRRGGFNWLSKFLNGLGGVFQVLFYLGAAAIVLMIAYFILVSVFGVRLSDLLGRKDKTKAEDGDDVLPSLKPDAAVARTLLEEADALASEGKYAEAVHLLLFRSIEDIQTRRGQRLSTALTAREIGELDDLPAKPRAALNPIIAIVEQSFFGGRPVDKQSWETARASYQDFAFGDAWT